VLAPSRTNQRWGTATPDEFPKPEYALPRQVDQLSYRNSRFGGPRGEWLNYLHRAVPRKLWHDAPVCAAWSRCPSHEYPSVEEWI